MDKTLWLTFLGHPVYRLESLNGTKRASLSLQCLVQLLNFLRPAIWIANASRSVCSNDNPVCVQCNVKQQSLINQTVACPSWYRPIAYMQTRLRQVLIKLQLEATFSRSHTDWRRHFHHLPLPQPFILLPIYKYSTNPFLRIVILVLLPCDALQYKERYCDRMSAVCPSVRLSVCLSVCNVGGL